mgnify:CR=1 FL=1
MHISAVLGSLTEHQCDALIVNLFEGVESPGGGTGAVDRAIGGAISDVIRSEQFKGKLGDTVVIRNCGGIGSARVVVVGLGKRESFGPPEIMRAAARAIRACGQLKARRVASILHGAGVGGIDPRECARATALGTVLGAYEHTRLKTENSGSDAVESFEIVEMSADKLPDIERGIRRAESVAEAVVYARDLVNEPSNVVTPEYLASQAVDIAERSGMECRILDRAGIEEAGMGLLAAVARGSAVEPRFIELSYTSPDAVKTVALVGKGITFDSGGYSLKRSDGLHWMKDDMAGAAAVLAAMRAVPQIKPRVNLLALVPATENMIGGSAIHPGDVFTSLAGKTVEVDNTDCEGRLILGDAIAYAVKRGVDEIIDLATLTGACVVALGRQISGIIGTDDELVGRLIAAGEACAEKLWRLPLHEAYGDLIKSNTADIKAHGGSEAGAIIGAVFIKNFVGDVPWAHIDLSASVTKKDTDLAKTGATGVGAGTLVEYLRTYCSGTQVRSTSRTL